MTDLESLLKEADMMAALPGAIIPRLVAAVRELQGKLSQIQNRAESAFVNSMEFRNKCTDELIVAPLRDRAEKAEAQAKVYREALENMATAAGFNAREVIEQMKRDARQALSEDDE